MGAWARPPSGAPLRGEGVECPHLPWNVGWRGCVWRGRCSVGCRRRSGGSPSGSRASKGVCFGPRPLLTGRAQAPPRKGPPEPNLEECGVISCKLRKVFPICAFDLMFLWQLLTQVCHHKPSDFLGDCTGFVFCKVESITNSAFCAYHIVFLK